MKRILKYGISREAEGKTLWDCLREKGFSRHIFTFLKQQEGSVLKNGRVPYMTDKLREGDCVTVTLLELISSPNIKPVFSPLCIRYEDEDLLVLNKPWDMPVHPSIHNHENTLANAVMWYYTSRSIPFVFRCVNRLDRDTSGLLILAKNILSASILSRMCARRKIHREYLAAVSGILPASGVITAPIGRVPGSVLMRQVDFKKGERAVTHYRKIHSESSASLALVRLETGRTHQIRVHMKSIGHPLLGDFLYYPESLHLLGRQALHSFRLSFAHPVTGERLTFTEPLPEDIRKLFPGLPPALLDTL